MNGTVKAARNVIKGSISWKAREKLAAIDAVKRGETKDVIKKR